MIYRTTNPDFAEETEARYDRSERTTNRVLTLLWAGAVAFSLYQINEAQHKKPERNAPAIHKTLDTFKLNCEDRGL